MPAEDRSRWNARYRERARRDAPAPPSQIILGLEPLLPRTGRALDLAGGAGRHAVWLAQRGLDVTIADISNVGLALAERAAVGAGVVVRTVETDLAREPLPPGPWDLILCFHYLDRSLFGAAVAELAPGGLFVLVQPTIRNLERHAKPSARFLLAEGEVLRLVTGLEIVRHDEGWSVEDRHEAVLVARRSGA